MRLGNEYSAKGQGIRNTFRMPTKVDDSYLFLLQSKFRSFNTFTPEFFNSISPMDANYQIDRIFEWSRKLGIPGAILNVAAGLGKYFHVRIMCTCYIVENNNDVKQTLTIIGNDTDVKLVFGMLTFFDKLWTLYESQNPRNLRGSRKKFKSHLMNISLILNKLLENPPRLTEKAEDLISIKKQIRDIYVKANFRIIKASENGKDSLDYLVTPHAFFRFQKFLC